MKWFTNFIFWVCMCVFNQDGVIFLLNGKPLKLVDQFVYLGISISSKFPFYINSLMFF